ncbi:DUF6299 family protein [Streptomyces sp. NPDC053048]|uniref:DUF6299 family protein n=1 Tax=Streptomyces sp. NPDC053048 TaxID=3365694 RepID=UPI0037D909CD
MYIRQARVREALGIATGAATLIVTSAATGSTPEAAAAAPPERPPNTFTIDRTARLAPDGTITLTGTYRCTVVAQPAGTVYVGSNIRQGGITHGIGGSVAACDGKEHRWRNSALPYRTRYRPGPARADGTLMQFKKDKSGIPLPHFLAVASERDVTLVPGR